MSYEITLDYLPVGYATTNTKEGKEAKFNGQGFSSTDEGDDFIVLLEGMPTTALSKIATTVPFSPSTVDHLLVIIRRDQSATVYLNELTITLGVKTKRDTEKGQLIFEDDIADIERLTFEGVSIPKDAGYFFLFSTGWRKGLVYDFGPLLSYPSQPFVDRNYDLEPLLGRYAAYLQFQHLFNITNVEWAQLLGQKWFPFISLKVETVKNMLRYVKTGSSVDDLLMPISKEIVSNAAIIKTNWQSNPVFADHVVMFEKALDEYLEEDYISANAILYPRIEGLLRTYHQIVNPSGGTSQDKLVDSAIGVLPSSKRWMLLPEKFDHYLRQVYFESFDRINPSNLSRHSVAHGVAPAMLFDLKAATIGFLTLQQLSYYLHV